MPYRSLGWIIAGAWLGAWPVAARADYLSSAMQALKTGDVRAAQIDLRNAVRNDPQDAGAHYWLARVDLELGDPVAAERETVAARERGYDRHKAVPLLAQAMLAQDRFQDLLDRLRPDGKDPALDADILVARGYAQIALKRPEEAGQSFAQAQREAPDAVQPLLADARLAIARADLANAQAKIDRALAAQPKSAEALLAKAQVLRLRNDAPGAMAVLDELIAGQPGVMQARLDRASLELATGKTAAAHADIGAVLNSTPGNVQAIYLTAVMDAAQRDYRAADLSLERISGFLGRIPRAYYLLAVVKEQLGQYAQAEDAARRYLGRSPDDLAAYKVLARIEFTRRRPDQVIAVLAKVAQSGKADAEAYDLLGRAYAATGQNQEAVDAFQKAETMAPDDVGVQTRLASARMGLGETDTAMGDLEHTLELAPKQPAVSEALFFAALGTGDRRKVSEALAKIRAAQGETDVVGNLEGLAKLARIDLPGARASFEAVIARHPDFVPAHVNLARTLSMLGQQAAAERELQAVLARQPASSPALTMLVAQYIQENRLPDAAAVLERAHRADPASTSLTVRLGEVYIRSGAPQKALDLAQAAKGANAGAPAILSLQGAAQLALGQKKAARETYEDILKQDPDVVGARRQLVALLVEAGEFESARSTLSDGIAADPKDYQLYLDYALVDLKSTGLEAALATAERLRSQNQDFAPLRALRGDVYMAANRPGDAAAAFQKAFDEAPSILLLSRLSGALLRSGQQARATDALQAWLDRNPTDMTALEQLSEIQIATSQLDAARKSLAAILAQKPHDPVVLNNLAWVCQQKGEAAQAQDLARQAYVLSPGPQTADTLGWILVSSGDPKDGLALLRQASIVGPSDPRILYHYAVALKDQGEKDEARKQLQLVVASQARFREKAEARKLLDDLSRGP